MAFKNKIFAKKFLINCGLVLLAGLASVYGNSPLYLACIPVLKGIENYIKHRK